ncbi:MAG: hypothetical protein CMH96_06365 [Oceanospirillaceae bacterium]|nr:hypothetical protein [Oceanospirillaceae bacterium]|tara:strand:- start:500 stop:2023 length:1524 start_codon:yes stop_codon:yes gene_type:complete
MDGRQEYTKSTITDEIDLHQILQPLWRNKWYILLLGCLSALIITIYQLGGFTLNKSAQAQMQIYFNFKGANEGVYPNGAKFSPMELLSEPVLSSVYDRHIDSEINYADFSQALTLTPNFSGSAQLEALISDLAELDKGLSVAEFNDAIETYTTSLQRHSKTNITLSLDLKLVQGNMGKATKILTAITDTWAKQALTDRGVMKLYRPHISSQIISFGDQEILININMLEDTQQRLAKTVAEFADMPQLASLTDPKSSLNLADLSLLLSNESKYQLAVLKEIGIKLESIDKSTRLSSGFHATKMKLLERERDRLQRMITTYDEALIQLREQQYNHMDSVMVANKSPSEQTIYAPQYNEDMVNSLLQLGSTMADPKYRQNLLQAKLNLSAQLQETITEIEFYQSSFNEKYDVILEKETIDKLIQATTEKLMKINDALTGITNLANNYYLSDKGQLYSLQGKIERITNSSLSVDIMQKVLLAFFMGCLLAVMVIFCRLIAAPRPISTIAEP